MTLNWIDTPVTGANGAVVSSSSVAASVTDLPAGAPLGPPSRLRNVVCGPELHVTLAGLDVSVLPANDVLARIVSVPAFTPVSENVALPFASIAARYRPLFTPSTRKYTDVPAASVA